MVICIAKLLISRFSFVRTPSVEKREGFFFPPKHSHEKFFRNFFQIYPRRLFADFLARICDEGKGCLLPAYGGGTPFLWACGLVGLSLPFFRFPFPRSLFPCGLPFPIGWQHREHLNPSGRLVLLCSSFFVGWCVASVPRSCLDSLGSLRT